MKWHNYQGLATQIGNCHELVDQKQDCHSLASEMTRLPRTNQMLPSLKIVQSTFVNSSMVLCKVLNDFLADRWITDLPPRRPILDLRWHRTLPGDLNSQRHYISKKLTSESRITKNINDAIHYYPRKNRIVKTFSQVPIVRNVRKFII